MPYFAKRISMLVAVWNVVNYQLNFFTTPLIPGKVGRTLIVIDAELFAMIGSYSFRTVAAAAAI